MTIDHLEEARAKLVHAQNHPDCDVGRYLATEGVLHAVLALIERMDAMVACEGVPNARIRHIEHVTIEQLDVVMLERAMSQDEELVFQSGRQVLEHYIPGYVSPTRHPMDAYGNRRRQRLQEQVREDARRAVSDALRPLREALQGDGEPKGEP